MPTRREKMIEDLERGQYSVKELAAQYGRGVRATADDLRHVRKSVGDDFQIDPARCMACGFVFRGRKRLTEPSRCPECRSEQIRGPYVTIERSDD
jgi:hypothetical protein